MKTLKDLRDNYIEKVTLTEEEKEEYERKTGTFLDGNVVYKSSICNLSVKPEILLNEIENIIKDRIKELEEETGS